MVKKVGKKKKYRQLLSGEIKIYTTFNNIIITATDSEGRVLAHSSAGQNGFKGSRKSTPFAAQTTAEKVAKYVMENIGMKSVAISMKGPGAGREPAVRAISNSGLSLTSIKDVTAVPHNGCRPPKRRRV